MKGKFKNLTCKEKALIGAGIGNIVLASLLVLIVLGVPIAQVNSVQQTAPATSQGFSTLLLVKAYDKDGNLIAERVKEGDLWLKNFLFIIYGVFNPREGSDPSFTTDTGETQTIDVKDYSTPSIFDHLGDSNNFVKIAIGTGTTTPYVDDYKLESEVARATVSEPQYNIIGNAMNITFSATFTLDTATDISESGVVIGCNRDTTVDVDWWMFVIRDTFDPVSVPAGGTITITYIIRLNA